MPLAYFQVLGQGGSPDNSLPPQAGWGDGSNGVYPGNGLPQLPGVDNTLPESPPGIWPPLNGNHPVQPLPPTTPIKPGTIWPPVQKPDNSLPNVPAPQGKFWVLVGIPGIGWRYVCIDIGLKPDNSLPVPGAGVDNTLPGQGGEVDNSLPGYAGRPDNSLPGQGGRPDNSLPGQGGRPDNSLPPTAQPKK